MRDEIFLHDKGPRYDAATVTILNVKQSADESDGDESEVGASVLHAGPLIEDELGDEMDDYGSRGRFLLTIKLLLMESQKQHSSFLASITSQTWH